ncbi:protein-(glutamine-N5) methyltransferase, release factor-specific [bacterium CG10_46_32]|nr:MAG: protein-(glutamine-N5) methyltransferase, release factor-specific [bacterium CG10_46_32]PIR55736.1 MAG: peptide chain release factor N(5)-glutamine methyltransferase [Parcubacteria group bacterium CG10_big_fil_rev_8_21_14_0_10_46_32]
MTIQELLCHAYKELAHLETPHLDAEIILAHVLKKPREYVLAHSEESLSDAEAHRCNSLIARRSNREPVAYLTNHKAFCGRDFYVDQRVHIPKPATEDMIDAIQREVPNDFTGTIADIGTGSGCIAVTLALQFPKAAIFATDISDDALAVAVQNAKQYDAHITFLKGSLGEPLKKPMDIVAANLPYGWHNGWTDDAEVFFQPEISYISGSDGLSALYELIKKLPRMLSKSGRAYLEFDPRQMQTITEFLAKTNYTYTLLKDTAGFDRILRLTK